MDLNLSGFLRICIHFFFAALTAFCICTSGEAEPSKRFSSSIDAVIIMDASGSLRITDPEGVRYKAAESFVSRLREGDRVAVVEFAEAARIIVPLTEISQKSQREISGAIYRVGDDGEYTDFLSAMELARELLEKEGREDSQKMVVLISDGKMDPHPATASPEKRISELYAQEVPLYQQANILVYTVAFSDLADKDLLREIAEATGGEGIYSPTSDELMNSIREVFSSLRASLLHRKDNIEKKFYVDDGVSEAVFVLAREEDGDLVLITPGGEVISKYDIRDDVRWYRVPKFEIITVTDPEEGDWTVSGLPSPESFATVLTHLKVIAEWESGRITANVPVLLKASFFEGRKPVALPEFTEIVKYVYQIIPTDKVSTPVQEGELNDYGKDGDNVENDGIFSSEVVIKSPGSYKLLLMAKSPTFTKKVEKNFEVLPPVVHLSIKKNLAESRHSEGKPHHKRGPAFIVSLDPEAASLRKRELLFEVTERETGKVYEYEVPHVNPKAAQYSVSTSIIDEEGDFEVRAVVTGRTRLRKIVRLK
ncbi:MAG: VWA domain-containing protein, partial [Candidatus Dadabacteria bacterium]